MKAAGAVLAALALAAAPAWAGATGEPAARLVAPGESLAAAVAAAAPGDTLRVRGGVHHGPRVIERPLTLVGEGWPVLDGGGRGTVVAIRAPGVSIEGFELRGSGSSLDEENSGIAVDGAPGAVIAGNRLSDVLFGIYLRRSPGSRVAGNRIEGKELPLARRGDAIRVWYSDRVTLEENTVTAGRDVVLWYSMALTVRGNRVSGGRYGLHFMYCDDATIAGNLLLENSVGAFLMYSRRLRLEGNTVAGNHGPSGYGVGLKDMDDAVVRGNLLAGNRVGAYLDNSPREAGSTTTLSGNLVTGNDVGVLLMPNVRRVAVSDNGFRENREQVSVAGGGGDPAANRWWANYWSDYPGFDADADGFGETPYRSERLFEGLADRHPPLRYLADAPAAGALELAARAFPLVRPQPKLTDPTPRMRPPTLAGLPPLPGTPRRGWGPLGGALLAAGLLLLVVPAGAAAAAARTESPPQARPVAADEGAPVAGPVGVEAPRVDVPKVEALVTVRDLGKSFGDRRALDGVSFAIGRGEAVAFWGPNGAGKTTALRALLGVMPFEGEVRISGLDPRRQGKAVRQRIGFVPQESAFQEEAGVLETLEFFAAVRGVGGERVAGLLGWLGLAGHAGDRVGELSGGLKQRLALGVALLADPPLLLLDEPTANLDAAAQRSIHELLLRLRKLGKTLVFTSHRLEEVLLLADRVLRLREGRLEAAGPATAAALDSAGRAELQLLVAPAQRADALALLAAAGYGPGELGDLVTVEIDARRKVEPLALLLRRGVEVEDLSISAATPVGGDIAAGNEVPGEPMAGGPVGDTAEPPAPEAG